MSRKVLSSRLTWESFRLRDFIILKSLPESKKVLLFWLRLFFVSTWTKLSVQTSYLATLWVSRGPIYLLHKREKRRSLGNYFSFLYWEKHIWARSTFTAGLDIIQLYLGKMTVAIKIWDIGLLLCVSGHCWGLTFNIKVNVNAAVLALSVWDVFRLNRSVLNPVCYVWFICISGHIFQNENVRLLLRLSPEFWSIYMLICSKDVFSTNIFKPQLNSLKLCTLPLYSAPT